MMQNHELIDSHRELRVGPTVIVGEFDLEVICVEAFDNRADLATIEMPSGNVFRECDDIE